jgi:hypothetical protein
LREEPPRQDPAPKKGHTRTIVLISCASEKLPYAAPAADLYVSELFRCSLGYARMLNPDAIYVLSAKYGLLSLDQVIEPYNLTLNEMPAAEIKVWAERVLVQLRKVSDLEQDRFIFLAGDKYRKYLVPHIRNYEVPMEGKRIGEQLQFLKRAGACE